MKRRWVWVLLVLCVSAAGVHLVKTHVPLHYKREPLDGPALQHLDRLQAEQTSRRLTPREIAEAYHYFDSSDYRDHAPPYQQVRVSRLSPGDIRVTLHNEVTYDDSVSETINRFYMRWEHGQQRWDLYRHEWSHQGRGRWGWTTLPTL